MIASACCSNSLVSTAEPIFFFDGIYEARVVNHSGYDGCDHLIDFVLSNVQPERTFVSSLPFDALAEVVVTSFVISLL